MCQRCFNKVSTDFQGSFKVISKVFLESLKGVSRNIKECFEVPLRLIQGSYIYHFVEVDKIFKEVSMV